jgi:acetyl esterase
MATRALGGIVPYRFDPELAPAIPTLPVTDFDNVVAARKMMDDLVGAMNAGVDVSTLSVEDSVIPGPTADVEVPVRVYQPRSRSGLLPAVLHIHGGGFAVGSIDSEHAMSAQAARSGAVVVSVDYRLAPEHPYPAGVEDCYAALRWLHDSHDELGVDSGRVAVFGNSAGGGLAAAVALLARDRNGPPLCFQFLGIPELDDRLETVSMTTFVDTPLWNRPKAVDSWRHYLGPDPGEVSPYAAPARATDLSGLPPAFISTMEFDPLRDEGIIYGLRLLQAGVSVEMHQYPGTFHGSSLIATAAISRRQATETAEVLRRALGI